MKAKRNTAGLKQNAQAKRKEAFDKVEQGIKTLLKEKRTINFNQVAEASGVSKAWLYKEPEIKARIEHLREQAKQGKKLPRRISATEASTKALNATIKARVKKVEAENRELRRQNETVYGQLLRLRKLERQVERLKNENERLKDRSGELAKDSTNIDSVLDSMNVKMNSTIERLIRETPESVVKTSIDALREAIKAGSVRNPGGFLYKPINDQWMPSKNAGVKEDVAEFNQWWKWSYREGLAIASERINGEIHIHTTNGETILFSEAIKLHPVEI